MLQGTPVGRREGATGLRVMRFSQRRAACKQRKMENLQAAVASARSETRVRGWGWGGVRIAVGILIGEGRAERRWWSLRCDSRLWRTPPTPSIRCSFTCGTSKLGPAFTVIRLAEPGLQLGGFFVQIRCVPHRAVGIVGVQNSSDTILTPIFATDATQPVGRERPRS